MRFETFGNNQFEIDLLNCKILPELIRDQKFATKLYETLCNHIFIKGCHEFFPSWRYAAGVVAYLRNVFFNLDEDYLDFYLSGKEGFVHQEIEEILKKLDWTIKKP